MFDQTCFHAVVELRFHADFKPARRWGGGYVNCWVLAEKEEEARRRIIEGLPKLLRADVVRFSQVGAGDPREVLTSKSFEGVDGRPATDAELREAFVKGNGLIHAAVFTWRRRKWWEFWKRDAARVQD